MRFRKTVMVSSIALLPYNIYRTVPELKHPSKLNPVKRSRNKPLKNIIPLQWRVSETKHPNNSFPNKRGIGADKKTNDP